MRYLSEDVQDFYRLRIVVTFDSGRIYSQTYGPFTKMSKAKEIRTRNTRFWFGRLAHQKKLVAKGLLDKDPNFVVNNFRCIIEMAPSFGWYSKSDDTYTMN